MLLLAVVQRTADALLHGGRRLGIQMELGRILQFLRRECPGTVRRDGVQLGKAGRQRGQHGFVVFVRHHAHHAHQIFLVAGLFQFGGKGGNAVRIVASIQQQQRMAAQYLHAGGHGGSGKAVQNGFIGNFVAEIPPERQRHLHRHGGVVRLMPSRHAQPHLIAAVIDEVFKGLCLLQIQILLVWHHQPDAGPFCCGGDNLQRVFGLVRVTHQRAARLEDARLFGGNFGNGIPENLGMVQTDFGDGGHQRAGHRVGGVAAAAKAGLQHHQITFFPGKPQQRQRGDCLEFHGTLAALLPDLLHRVQNLLGQRGEGAGRDHLPVDLKALPEIRHKGTDRQTGLVPGFGEDAADHGREAPLAVGACNMHAGQLRLGIAQMRQQVLHTGQCGRAAHAGQCVQCLNGLLCGHGCSSL